MKSSLLHRPEFFFLVIAIITGLICVFFIPVGIGFDESAHTRRIWEMSGGTIIPNYLANKFDNFPLTFEKYLSIPPFFDDLSIQIGEAVHSSKIDWWQLGNGISSSTYFPTLYIPQSLVMLVIGRNFDAPSLLILYLIRLTCLLSFIIPTFYSIKLIPHSKWLFTSLTLVPMALLQSGTISPEGLSNGFAFLFLAWILKESEDNQIVFSRRQVYLLLIMTAILFTIKLNLVVLVILLLLFSKKKFQSKFQLGLVIAGIIGLFILIVIGWNYITRSSLSTNGGHTPGIVLEQAKYILSNPLKYSKIVAADFIHKIADYFLDWIAVFPTQYLRMPWFIYALYSVSILFFIIFDPTNKKLNTKKRLILILTALVGYLITVTLLYLKDTPVGSQSILRVQGRYFIAIFPLIFLSLISNKITIDRKIFWPIAIVLISIVPVLFSSAVVLRYSLPCGLSYLTGEECYKPSYRNWAPNTAYSDLVIPGMVIQQTIQTECNNLNLLRLWTDRSGHNGSGSTSFSIQDAVSGVVLTEQKIDNNQIPEQNWLSIPFSPIYDSAGKTLEIKIWSEDSNVENAAKISLSYRQEYDKGTLLINNQVLDTDLIFQYGCCVKPNCNFNP